MKKYFWLIAVSFGLMGNQALLKADPPADCFTLYKDLVSKDAQKISPPKPVPQEAPELRGHMIALTEFGAEDLAYFSLPQKPPVGGVVVLHDMWGLNDQVKRVVDELADQGFIAIAPDLLNGVTTADANRARELLQGMRVPSVIKGIQASTRLLKQSPKFKVPNAAALGWGMGGGLSIQAACEIKELDAAVVFYGPVELNSKRTDKIKIPILGIFPANDPFIPADNVKEFETLLKESGKVVKIHYFNAHHGFVDPGEARDEQAGKAWKTALDFLNVELGKPPRPKTLGEKIEKILK